MKPVNKTLLNLASEPFRNRRLFWLFILAVIGAASWVGMITLDSKLALERELAMVEPKVKKLETQAKGEAVDFTGSTLTIAQNQALIVAQDLITRKGFSWSQLLNDLERFIAPTVRVTHIAVDQVGRTKDATGKSILLSFDVVGKSATDVTAMIRSLNESGRFSVFPSIQKPVEGTGEMEFQLEVVYEPPQSSSSHSAAVPAQVVAQGGAKQ